MTHFVDIADLDDLKKAYRNLCKLHHPDKGGCEETMKAINAEYSYMLKNYGFDFKGSSVEIEEQIRDIIEQTETLKGLIVELCGRWVWFTGDTRTHKDKLKSIGCFWASKKLAWYWRPQDEAKKGAHKTYTLDKIRETHGSRLFSRQQILID